MKITTPTNTIHSLVEAEEDSVDAAKEKEKDEAAKEKVDVPSREQKEKEKEKGKVSKAKERILLNHRLPR